MDQEGIRRKIKSLLALAGSDNENEALAAAQTARRLMLKYHISMSEDSWNMMAGKENGGSRPLSRVVTKTLQFRTTERKLHHLMLAHVLAKNFRCRTFCQNKEIPCICFIGYEEDAYAALALMEYLVRFMEQGIRRYLENSRTVSGGSFSVKDRERCRIQEKSWREGFCTGVIYAFERQTLEKPGYGIMLTIPKEVEAVYEKLKIKKITYTDRKDHSSMDGEAFYYGKSTGKRAVDERWISPQK